MTLPTGWVETTLGETCELYQPQTISKSEMDESGEFPVFGANGPIGRYHRFNHERPQLLMTCRGATCGTINVSDPMSWITGNSMVIRPTADEIYVRFVECYLRGAVDISVAISGSAQPQITRASLEPIVLPLPPLAEQRRIVAKLDTLTARLTRARTELDRVAALASRVRISTLAKVFDISSVAVIPLGNVLADIQSGKSLKCDERKPLPNERGVVKVSAISSETFKASEAKILPEGYKPPDSHRIKAGDLLLARASGSINLVGRVALVENDPQNLYLSDKILRLELSDGLAPWVYWFLRSPQGRSQMVDAASGISMHNVTQSSLAALILPLPDESIRGLGLSILQTAFTRADRLEAEAARARALLDRLEAAILARAFRGELVPQDPSDEPASVLLNRIRATRAAAPTARRGRRANAGT